MPVVSYLLALVWFVVAPAAGAGLSVAECNGLYQAAFQKGTVQQRLVQENDLLDESLRQKVSRADTSKKEDLEFLTILDDLVTRAKNPGRPSLEKALAAASFDEDTLRRMRESSRGLVSVDDLARNFKVKDGYSLGFTTYHDLPIYNGLSDALELSPWQRAYLELEVDSDDMFHTETFMKKITESGQPIVFFVPPGIGADGKPSITKNELNWLLADRARMRNVVFVFGAYDLIPVEKLDVERLSNTDVSIVVNRAMKKAVDEARK